MRTVTVFSALTAVTLSLGTASLHAQSASIQATATVLSAITVTGTNLAFGNVTPGVNKTVAITDAGAGLFTVTKAAATSVALTFTLPTNLTVRRQHPADRHLDRRLEQHRQQRRGRDRLHAERVGDDRAVGRREPVGVGRWDRVAGGAQAAGAYAGNVTMQVAYL